MCNFIWERWVVMFSIKEHAKMLHSVSGRVETSGSEDIFYISNFWYHEKIASTSQRWIIYVKKSEYTCSSFVIFRGSQSIIKSCMCAFCQFVIVPLLSFIHSTGLCRMRRSLAFLRSFFHSSLWCTFSCHPSPPTILPSSLNLAIYFLVYLSNLSFQNSYIIPFWEFYFLPFSVHAQTNVICLTIWRLMSTISGRTAPLTSKVAFYIFIQQI